MRLVDKDRIYMRLIHEDRAIHKISRVMRLVRKNRIIEVQVRSYTSELDTDYHMYVCRQYKNGQLQTPYIIIHSHTHMTHATHREKDTYACTCRHTQADTHG